MVYLLIIVSATIVSLLVIPVMMKLAPRLGMIDVPDERKVHSMPIPRVGGWGIIVGSMLPILFLIRMDDFLATFVFGAFTLLMFGALDDSKEMGHHIKFVGQLLAVAPLVTYGGLYISNFPFLTGIELPAIIGIPFTVVALVGVINAANQSDGLDGLAGGETIISCGAFALLSYLSNAHLGIVISISALGGILGFLRYNTYPATVFMGDGGSQFLGFSLGVLAVFITQEVDTSLSPSVVLLLLGLPVVDSLAVFYKRAVAGGSPFVATRDHIHHSLLDLGLAQKESVTFIYVVHAMFVFSGIWLRHSSDWVIMGGYLLAVSTIFTGLWLAKKRGWKLHEPGKVSNKIVGREKASATGNWLLVSAPRQILESLVPVYLIAVSLWVNEVPRDFGIVAAVLGIAVFLQNWGLLPMGKMMARPTIYIAAVFVIYLCVNDRPSWGRWWLPYLEIAFYSLIAISVAVSVRFSPRRRQREFHSTALDYLIVLVGIGALPFIRAAQSSEFNISLFVVVLGVMLYGCELLFVERRERSSWLNKAALLALMIIAARGLEMVEYELHLKLPRF